MSHLTIKILAEEYDAFKRLIPNNESLPETHQDWVKRCAQDAKNKAAQGRTVNEVTIHPEEFAIYCDSVGRTADHFTLGEFAVYKFARQR